ncbi:SGS-domain-containing protein [Eremomyces bilateralis CBS 781.70]|uniref:SGS-domain-containing protein n=1 Tax=Eremomyces bilateralis CBS 781.70 TaxID=1392243 RepID=A0A6G1GHX7_9PEZI|nr:SGS-domain-containing protein [Eremomyces bilateralis CBS 781.70]KAF1817556.1 SGS-domain-containing protein [Eremomyces bilateralis CBS 781.70]
MDQAAKGATALEAGKFAEAIKLYSAAIAVNPNAVDYYIKRSTALQRSSPPDYSAALNDAEHAIILAIKRARKELIAQAQLRRAIVLFGLERYADTEFVLGIVKRLDPKDKLLAIWEMKLAPKLRDLPADDLRAKRTVEEIPSPQQPTQSTQPESKSSTLQTPQAEQKDSQAHAPAAKIRHDWYQSSDTVYFTLLAKGVPNDQAQVEISEQSISISFPTITGATFEYTLDPLFAFISPASSSYNITPSKVELTLKKSFPGQKWPSLDGSATDAAPITSSSTQNPVRQPVVSDKPPSYPSSSKHGPKDWDHDDTFDVDSDDEGDDINKFFKHLYKGADPDVRRAMVKSYQESNGTALSTNWGEVGKGQVETLPPEGMEAKKWNE